MKRKNLILRNRVFLLLVSALVLLTFKYLDTRNYQGTVALNDPQTVQFSLKSAEQHLRDIADSGREDAFFVQPDVSVVLVFEGQAAELNTHLEKISLSEYIKSSFLASETGKEFLAGEAEEPVYFSFQNQENKPQSFFALARQTERGILLITKDATANEAFSHNNELLFFGLMIASFTIIAGYATYQRRHIYLPISEMTELAYQYSENNFSNSRDITSNDQIGHLATAINKIGKALEASNIMNTKERELMIHVYDSLEVGVIYVSEDHLFHTLNAIGQHYYVSFIKNKSEGKYVGTYYENLLQEALCTREAIQVEIQQNQLIYELEFLPLDSLTGVLIFIKDVTSAKQLASIREDLITNVSHDLRTPLATIQGYSEAIMDDIVESIEDKNEMARIIHDEATQMSQMITSLLEVSRMKAGYSEIQRLPVYLPEFFARLINRFAQTLNSEGIICDLKIADGTTYFPMDEDRMHYAIYNLIDNAIQYAAQPGSRATRFIRIEVELDGLVDDLLIRVSDNGIGISKQSIPYIFDRFYKDDKARTTPKKNGSGIGLSLVDNIVKEHQGTITVESEQDKGTSFLIRIPLLEDRE